MMMGRVRNWFAPPVHRVETLVWTPDPVGSAQGMAAALNTARHGGRLVPMAKSFSGYLTRAQSIPTMSPSAGTLLRSTNRGLPNTQSPDGRPVAGSASELLLRASSIGSGV